MTNGAARHSARGQSATVHPPADKLQAIIKNKDVHVTADSCASNTYQKTHRTDFKGEAHWQVTKCMFWIWTNKIILKGYMKIRQTVEENKEAVRKRKKYNKFHQALELHLY